MALFESGNPTLSEKIFNRSLDTVDTGVMTVRGTMQKFGFLMLMVLAAAGYTWHLYDQGKESMMMIFLMVGGIGGLIMALIICFKPTTSTYLAPAYGILEGFFLGGISAIMNEAFKAKYPGLVMQAVGLTMAVALAMFLLYNFRVIKATERFKSIIFTATAGIALFYVITFVLGFFGINIPFMSINATGNAGLIGIGFSLFVVGIAALNLIIDFDMIEKGAAAQAPKHMEWYSAFGLLITIVWLYIEILKLLARLANRK